MGLERTIKYFVANSQPGRMKCVEKKNYRIAVTVLRRIKCEASRNPFSFSAVTLQNSNLMQGRLPLRHKGVWAGILKDERLFRINDGLKVNFINLLPVFRRHFLQAVV
ncbi:hypothetical protein CHARACLAT_011960 [Characodon lateralis]|uniref:Uncharacterized protein n=1 Tax=Characodon lateralis TaxID=208331 RepID=A0ABU7F2B1_9TELE|nr:hypothetical protein [Characodon lateralis]